MEVAAGNPGGRKLSPTPGFFSSPLNSFLIPYLSRYYAIALGNRMAVDPLSILFYRGNQFDPANSGEEMYHGKGP